jgi:Peptidase M50B-like
VDASTLGDVWQDVVGVQPQPPLVVVVGCAVVALVIVANRASWQVARNVVTIAHEGGHALVALLAGRRLAGIRLHSDTSGVTISRGRPTGPGVVATAFAGYVAPSVLGTGFAALLGLGHVTAVLWVSIALLGALLLAVRNIYGVVSILATGLAIFVVSWYAGPRVQGAVAYAFTWFLLFAAVRPLGELQRKRSRGLARDSDADQLARLTGIPGLAWVLLFGVLAVGAAAVAGSWLVPWRDLGGLLS